MRVQKYQSIRRSEVNRELQIFENFLSPQKRREILFPYFRVGVAGDSTHQLFLTTITNSVFSAFTGSIYSILKAHPLCGTKFSI